MSSPSQAVASDVLARLPSVERRARSREFVYALIAIALLFVVLAASAWVGMHSAPLAGEEGGDAVPLQPLVAD